MSIIASSRGLHSLKTSSARLRLYHVGRAANVNTAIAKGIRASNGFGFRGTDNDSRARYLERNGVARDQGAIIKHGNRVPADGKKSNSRSTRGQNPDWKTKNQTQFEYGGQREQNIEQRNSRSTNGFASSSKERRGGRDDSNRPRYPAGADAPKSSNNRDSQPQWKSRGKMDKPGFARSSEGPRKWSADSRSAIPHRSNKIGEERKGKYPSLESKGRSFSPGSAAPYSSHKDGEERRERYPSLESKERAFPPRNGGRDNKSAERYLTSKNNERFDSKSSDRREKPSKSGWQDRSSKTSDRSVPFERKRESFDSRPQYPRRDQPERQPTSRPQPTPELPFMNYRNIQINKPPMDTSQNNNADLDASRSQPRITKIIDNRIPLSIPYTTPASEFLYGTSVVEAALASRRIPARKLYKLYIYTGENREKGDQDADIEKLARKIGVSVAKVGSEWIRMLDKMSGGRPHNGYILEASPLPRLPITSLGPLSEKDGLDGFEVVVDHQSKEDMAVNGSDSFIRIPRNRTGRKPLVLFLDSILDPGNLGGIIRTASFLGVTAVAMSTRNCAPFTPVVLKASAGASENITIFSVNKPSGFVVGSQAAGWKVYASVAPSKKKDPDMPKSIATHKLNDPLSEHPCLLMLGGEGEGLRWNLRSKADSDIYIQGSGESHKVDSLNVSVAAGILCNSFLRSRSMRPREDALDVEQSAALPALEPTTEQSLVADDLDEDTASDEVDEEEFEEIPDGAKGDKKLF